jgi:hypothetical protein
VDRLPPVRYPVGRDPSLALALIVLWVLALAPMLAALVWRTPVRSHGWALTAALVVASALGVWCTWRFWRAQTPGELVWNGAEWSLEREGVTVVIAHLGTCCDGQRALLLRAHGNIGRRVVWLWVGRAGQSARWHLLRCALYAPVPAMLT